MLLDMGSVGLATNSSSGGSSGRDARGNGQSGKEALNSVDERQQTGMFTLQLLYAFSLNMKRKSCISCQ